jgi:hypothetical protein
MAQRDILRDAIQEEIGQRGLGNAFRAIDQKMGRTVYLSQLLSSAKSPTGRHAAILCNQYS